MSQYGTHPEYTRGYNEGADETAALYDGLMAACEDLLKNWSKNLTKPAQDIHTAMERLRHTRRLYLE